MIGFGIPASFLPDRPTAGSEHSATTRTGVR